MALYSFKETLLFFSEKLKLDIEEEELKKGESLIAIDNFLVTLKEKAHGGGLHMELTLAILLYPLAEDKLKELICGNFLGINTGGCTLALHKDKDTICLHADAGPSSSPQENWEWLHRLLSVGREWSRIIAPWEECLIT